MLIDIVKLDSALRAAGILIHGCSDSGRIDFVDSATQGQRDLAEQILAAHDPTPPSVVSLSVDSPTLIGDGTDEVVLSVRGVPLADVTIDVLTGTTSSTIQLTLDAEGSAVQPFSCETAPCVIVFSAGDVSCKVRSL